MTRPSGGEERRQEGDRLGYGVCCSQKELQKNVPKKEREGFRFDSLLFNASCPIAFEVDFVWCPVGGQ
jgi:hypothetical protein